MAGGWREHRTLKQQLSPAQEGNSPEALERLKALLAEQLTASGITDFDLG